MEHAKHEDVFIDGEGDPLSFAATLLMVLSLTIPWLVAAWRSGEPLAARMGLLWPAVGLLSYVYCFAPGAAEALYDPWRLHDVARALGLVILVYAVTRYDVLGVPLPRIVGRQGAHAATAIAILLGVARFSQNVVSAEAGLLIGVVVAGTVLLVAVVVKRPVQRSVA